MYITGGRFHPRLGTAACMLVVYALNPIPYDGGAPEAPPPMVFSICSLNGLR